MSEINSIANGTFTIGQTSATNFVAGPGIKIDEPSAGTVRIANEYNRLVLNNVTTAGYFIDGNDTYPILQESITATFNTTTAYNTSNVIVNGSNKPWSGENLKKWIDDSLSYLNYNNAVTMPISYQLDATRQGSVLLLKNGSLSLRCKDSSVTPITGLFTIKWLGTVISGGNE